MLPGPRSPLIKSIPASYSIHSVLVASIPARIHSSNSSAIDDCFLFLFGNSNNHQLIIVSWPAGTIMLHTHTRFVAMRWAYGVWLHVGKQHDRLSVKWWDDISRYCISKWICSYHSHRSLLIRTTNLHDKISYSMIISRCCLFIFSFNVDIIFYF